MIREYLVTYKEFCGIKCVASYGKTCQMLNETERIMCECAEIDLEDAESYFRKQRCGREGSTSVIFRDCELKIPALEQAARIRRTEQVSNAFDISIVPAKYDFPEFSSAVEARHPSGSIYYTWENKQ